MLHDFRLYHGITFYFHYFKALLDIKWTYPISNDINLESNVIYAGDLKFSFPSHQPLI